jgi:tetratricopeptide (TPR) repeat protein
MRLGALGQAEHFLRKGIGAGETAFEVRRDLASVVSQQERPDEALALYRHLAAERVDPDLVAVSAILLDKVGRNAEALEVLEQLARDFPANAPILVALGHSLRAAGRVDEAIAAYREALASDATFGEAWWSLASIKSKVLGEPDVTAMQAALDEAEEVRHLAPIHFALGRAFHDAGNHEAAFRHYNEGNRLRAESLRYDRRELTQEVAEIEQRVGAAFLAGMSTETVSDSTPVFIVSLPRSGSTLLEQMLGSHAAIEPAGELPYIPALLRGFMELVTRQGKVTVPQAIAALSDRDAAALGNEYIRRAGLHRKTDKPFFVDKLPHNWSNIVFIRRILPQARFIDIRRPAMDCCFSNFTQSFTSAHASSFALEDVGQCYVDYVRLMRHLDGIAPSLVHHVSYADLVADPRPQLAAALAYLGLEWDDSVLEFHRLDRVVRTPSSEQVRRPLNRDGMEVWKPYEPWLAPLRDVLGDLAKG